MHADCKLVINYCTINIQIDLTPTKPFQSAALLLTMYLVIVKYDLASGIIRLF